MTITIGVSQTRNASVLAIWQGSQCRAAAASATVALETGNSSTRSSIPNPAK